MDRILDICDKYGLTMVKEFAHTLGTRWRGRHMGSFGAAAAWSCEQKMLGAAEAGFVTTDDEYLAAKVTIAAGAYDDLFETHLSKPPREYFERVRYTTPHFSMRMSSLAAALIRPQLTRLDERIARYQHHYAALEESLPSEQFATLLQHDTVSTSMLHFLQFYPVGFERHAQALRFVGECARRGVWVECMGATGKPWDCRAWRYGGIRRAKLPQTEANTLFLIDVKLPLEFEEHNIRQLAEVLIAARREVLLDDREAASATAACSSRASTST